MFRNLIKELADEYNIIAPDYPGFGNSDQPSIDEFEYTFDNLANVINNFVEGIKLDKYSIYVQSLRSQQQQPQETEVQDCQSYQRRCNVQDK